MTDRMVTLQVPESVALTLRDAIHCYMDCIEGKREAVEEIWLLEDDKRDTGGSFIHGAEQLYELVSGPLEHEMRHMDATNPELQDLLHRHKMWEKYGPGNVPKGST